MKTDQKEKKHRETVVEQSHATDFIDRPGGGAVPEKARSDEDNEGVKPGGGAVPEKAHSEDDNEGVKDGHGYSNKPGERNIHFHFYL